MSAVLMLVNMSIQIFKGGEKLLAALFMAFAVVLAGLPLAIMGL